MQLFNIWRATPTQRWARRRRCRGRLWKCVGMRRVICIVDVPDPDTLDQMLLDMPIMQELASTSA